MVKEKMSGVSTIRSKLIAAIAMLLVGVFMIVSSSYAWFTLSTAPEVTGIYTSVGANGNLEMALVPEDGDLNKITSGVGDSGKNETWGNLVDLGQTTGNQNNYGLDKIQLLPSRLDFVAATDDSEFDYTLAAAGAGLLAPKYGADGRVSSLTSTIFGKYNSNTGSFDQAANVFGVAAIGTASDMTPQQAYWMQAKKTVSAKLASAQNYADKSFENTNFTREDTDEEGNPITVNVSNGEMLANVIMARAIDGTNAVCDIRFVPDMVAQLKLANAELKAAMEAYIGALAAVAFYDKDANTWSSTVAAIGEVDVDSITGTSVTIAGVPVDFSADTGFTTVLAKYTAIKAILNHVETTYTTYAASGDAEAAAWTDTSAILFTDVESYGKFVDYNEVTLNGRTPTDIKENIIGNDASPSNTKLVEFGMDFVANGVVDFTSGSGVHADLAEVVGEYQSEISVTVKYGDSSLVADDVKLRAVKDAGVTGVNLYDKLTTQPAGSDGAAQSNPITDVYGYKLDFAFRTNATGSSLMLQTTPTGRIYTDGADETMGNGSSMTFTILDDTFTQDQAKKLMTAVRIVFLDKAGNIVALGLLEQDVTAENAYEISANGDITSYISLYKFTRADDGKLVKGDKIDPNDKGQTELMSLTQNEATQLSTLVYLDGDIVDNTMVPAGSTASISGSLNLQFSSSADLQPMDYTEFMGSDETSTEATGN